jgi:hypothetical protein
MSPYYRWDPPVRNAFLRSQMMLASFRQGFDEVRQGAPLNPDAFPPADFLAPLGHLQSNQKNYEEGRAFAALRPDIELMIGDDLHPQAVKLFVTAQKEWRDAVAARFSEERRA